jgi:carbon storage regulator
VLILSRRVGQKIVIAKDIIVVVSKIDGSRVKLGIEAPAHVVVVREELKAKEGEEAE